MLIESKASSPAPRAPLPLLCCLLRAEGTGRILHVNCLPRRKLSEHLHGDRLENGRNAIHFTNERHAAEHFEVSEKGLEFKTLFFCFFKRRRKAASFHSQISSVLMQSPHVQNCIMNCLYRLCTFVRLLCVNFSLFVM